MRIIKPPTRREYAEAKITELESFAPQVKACSDCGWPVVDGYCCNYCGSAEPDGGSDVHYQYALELGKYVAGKVRGLAFYMSERTTPPSFGGPAPGRGATYWDIAWKSDKCRDKHAEYIDSAKVDMHCNLFIGAQVIPADDPTSTEKLLAYVRKTRRSK